MNKRPSDITIEKVLNGLASPDEARHVANWLSTEEGQKHLSEQMDKDWLTMPEGSEELYVGHAIPSDEMYEAIVRHINRKKRRRLWLQVAAVAIPFLFILGGFYYLNQQVDIFGTSEMCEIQTKKGERIQVVFQDGTKVYLNSGSKMTYPKQFGFSMRTVAFEGEGYFVVSANHNRPFMVQLDKAEVKVLGTSFNVQAYEEDENITVTLDEGIINFKSWTNEQNKMKPGESMRLDKRNGKLTNLEVIDTKPISLWKDDIISFKNASLNDVIKVLNRWYDVAFVVESQEAYSYSYTITSENTTLEKVLNDLERVAPVLFIYEQGVVKVRVK